MVGCVPPTPPFPPPKPRLRCSDSPPPLHPPPPGHAYAAVISACAAGSDWVRAVQLFEEMSAAGITPDVVSCTALITALASAGVCEGGGGRHHK